MTTEAIKAETKPETTEKTSETVVTVASTNASTKYRNYTLGLAGWSTIGAIAHGIMLKAELAQAANFAAAATVYATTVNATLLFTAVALVATIIAAAFWIYSAAKSAKKDTKPLLTSKQAEQAPVMKKSEALKVELDKINGEIQTLTTEINLNKDQNETLDTVIAAAKTDDQKENPSEDSLKAYLEGDFKTAEAKAKSDMDTALNQALKTELDAVKAAKEAVENLKKVDGESDEDFKAKKTKVDTELATAEKALADAKQAKPYTEAETQVKAQFEIDLKPANEKRAQLERAVKAVKLIALTAKAKDIQGQYDAAITAEDTAKVEPTAEKTKVAPKA